MSQNLYLNLLNYFHVKMRALLFGFILCLSSVFAKNNDSLWTIWQSQSYHDTLRMEAIHDIAWSYINSNPDSALYFGFIELNFCKLKKDKSRQTDALNTLGVAHLMKSRYDSALYYMQLNAGLLEELGENHKLGVCKVNMGSIYGRQDMLYEALGYFYDAVEIFERSNDSLMVVKSFFNIGVIHKKLGEYETALQYYFDALETSRSYELPDMESLCYTNIGNTYVDLGRTDSATFYIHKALAIQEERGDLEGQARSHNVLAGNFLATGDIDPAKYHAHYAIKLRRMVQDINGLANTQNLLGRIHFETGRIDSAGYYFRSALRFAEEASSVADQMDAHNGLYKVYDLKGNIPEAYENYKQYILFRDSINSEENVKALAQQEIRYNFNKKAAEDSLAHQQELFEMEKDKERNEAIALEKDRRNTLIKISGTVVLVLVLGIALVLFRSNKRRRADNILIAEQKREVEQQKHVVEEKNNEITDSINYARRIQAAILPPVKLIAKYLPDSFVLYMPKDIVAGDFYWFFPDKTDIHLAVADCTGHGVPGALVSVVCHNALTRSVREFGLNRPNEILDKTRELVVETFEKSEEDVKDGMDISLCTLSLTTFDLNFSGANNSIYLLRDGELTEFKADKQPVGKYDFARPFTVKNERLQKGDTVYLFSDGFADQFGGPKGKKLKYSSLKDFLLANCDRPMSEQQRLLGQYFEDWRGGLEQVDDVCIIGFRV